MHNLRSLVVHMDSSTQAMNRLATARQWAAGFGAQVTALYAVTPWLLKYPVATDMTGQIAAQLSEWDQERLSNTRSRVEAAIQGDPSARWAELGGQTPYDFARVGLCADLLVLGQRNAQDPAADDVPADFSAHAIVHSGTPALIVPTNEAPATLPRTIVLAWNNTRESARALKASLPLLGAATRIHVVCWRDEDEAGLSALMDYLQRHGLSCDVHLNAAPAPDLGMALLDFAIGKQADLIVMGCYGHSRAREWVFGGVTQFMLASTSIPTLMAH